MKDLTRLTTEEANKIEMVLLMLEQDVVKNINTYEGLASSQNFSDNTKQKFIDNAEWWREAYELIYGGSRK